MGDSEGGPFSEGCFSYNYYQTEQYGILDISDNGSSICITLTGWRSPEPEPLVTWSVMNFILFYFILFYLILFYFILFILFNRNVLH